MYTESANNKHARNLSHLAHQGLEDVKAAMGQIFQSMQPSHHS